MTQTDISREAVERLMLRVDRRLRKVRSVNAIELLNDVYTTLRALLSHIAAQDAAHEARDLALIKAATDPAYGFNGVQHDTRAYAEFLEMFNTAYRAQKEKKDD